MTSQTSPIRGIKAIGIFLFLGAAMAFLAGMTLVWRGTPLGRLWALNARAYLQLVPYGKVAGVAFLLLGATLALAAAGWFWRRRWAWTLTVTIIGIQVVGNLWNVIRGDFLSGCVGLGLAGSLLFFLLRPQVRAGFAKNSFEGAH